MKRLNKIQKSIVALLGTLAIATVMLFGSMSPADAATRGGYCRWEWGIQYSIKIGNYYHNKWGPVYRCGYNGPGL